MRIYTYNKHYTGYLFKNDKTLSNALLIESVKGWKKKTII